MIQRAITVLLVTFNVAPLSLLSVYRGRIPERSVITNAFVFVRNPSRKNHNHHYNNNIQQVSLDFGGKTAASFHHYINIISTTTSTTKAKPSWGGHLPRTKSCSRTELGMGIMDDLFSKLQIMPTKETSKKKTVPKVKVPDGFSPPEPKPNTLTRMDNLSSVLKSSAALAVRLGTGAFVLGWKIDTLFAPVEDGKYALELGPLRIRDSSSVLSQAPRPQVPLILYEYDASPYCKRVREMINLLDLTVEYRPCPGARMSQFSEDLFERTGRRTVPYLIDLNNKNSNNNGVVEMFESNDQIEYLLKTYGPPATSFDRKALWPITWEPFAIFTCSLAALLRDMPAARRQPNARPDNEQMLPLELWAYECSPFVRPVREKLGSLCLPHIMKSCSRGSANRDVMWKETGGRFQVPYLVDPNTGIKMFEGPEIVEYLEAVYTVEETS